MTLPQINILLGFEGCPFHVFFMSKYSIYYNQMDILNQYKH